MLPQVSSETLRGARKERSRWLAANIKGHSTTGRGCLQTCTRSQGGSKSRSRTLFSGAYGEVHLIRNPFDRKYIPDDVIALKAIDLEHRREDSKQKFRNEVLLLLC